jgi:hypothetical protein
LGGYVLGEHMKLKTLIKKLIDLDRGFGDNDVYIELTKYHVEHDSVRYYKFKIKEVEESHFMDDSIRICGSLNSCTEVGTDYSSVSSIRNNKKIEVKRKVSVSGEDKWYSNEGENWSTADLVGPVKTIDDRGEKQCN